MIGNGPNQIDDRTPPLTPQLALRVAPVGGFALILFAVLFFRLWFLQVLNSNQYAKAAATNITRHVPVEAPRGQILGLTGKPLVQSVPVPSVSISPTDLPVRLTTTNMLNQPYQDKVIYRRLGTLLKTSTRSRKCTVTVYYTGYYITYSHNKDVKVTPTQMTPSAGTVPLMPSIECKVAKSVAASQYSNVTIKTGISADVRDYIDENQNKFQGVLAQEGFQRRYLLGESGAQLFGYVGPLNGTELKEKKFSGVTASDSVGQAGLEYQYDQDLRGIDGYDAVKVNANNEFEGYAKGKSPLIGNDVKLSLSAKLEAVGQASLEKSITLNAAAAGADAGAFVAMDPQNGKVYAMGSAPSYKPSIYNDGLSAKEYRSLNAKSSNYPLLNRAIQGVGPDGSTFKVITSTAALESGSWSVNDQWDDPGQYCIPGTPTNVPGDCRHNSTGDSGGQFDLETALEASDDDFFFHLGYLLYRNPEQDPGGGPLQTWARAYGVGRKTGIDLPDEQPGTLASPKLFKELYKQEIECEHATGPYKGHPKHPNGCGIAEDGSWNVGDSLNTALGQGDIQVTPLQLAVIYSAVENGGTIVTPHLAEDVQTATGTILHRFDPAPKRTLHINPLYLQTIQQGLYLAANGPSGTSTDVMGNFGKTVYGKTGTAQYGNTTETSNAGGSDYAWYAAYVPSSETSKPIVVVVWVEKGGFGDVAAAPVARQILHQWFYGNPGPYKTGTSTDT